jgi:16S rRNA (guanine527-N7)-methyltransferase
MFHVKHSSPENLKLACGELWQSQGSGCLLRPWTEAAAMFAQLIAIMLTATRTRGLLAASQRTESALWEHVYDSLQALSLIDPAIERHVADAGSGNGFPGIPLAIAIASLEFSLIERSAKKVEFLEYAVAFLSLPNVRVCAGELADFDWKQNAVDLALLRALVPPHELGTLFSRAERSVPRLLVFTTPQSAGEWSQHAAAAGYQTAQSHRYDLPGRSAPRELLKFARA